MNITPAFLEILFWLYTTPEEFSRTEAPYYIETIDYLKKEGLIRRSAAKGRTWEINENGTLYIKAILKAANDVPLPYYTCAPKLFVRKAENNGD